VLRKIAQEPLGKNAEAREKILEPLYEILWLENFLELIEKKRQEVTLSSKKPIPAGVSPCWVIF